MSRQWMSPKRSKVSVRQLERVLLKLKQKVPHSQIVSCCTECALALRMILSVTTASSDAIFPEEHRQRN